MVFEASVKTVGKHLGYSGENYGLRVKSRQERDEDSEYLRQHGMNEESINKSFLNLQPFKSNGATSPEVNQLNIMIPAQIWTFVYQNGDICHGDDLIFVNKVITRRDKAIGSTSNKCIQEDLSKITDEEAISKKDGKAVVVEQQKVFGSTLENIPEEGKLIFNSKFKNLLL